MNFEAFRLYCLEKPNTTEEFPFTPSVAVFKVCGKMFALTDVRTFDKLNLKCDPDKAMELREQYEGVQPGYHMNKKHWITVDLDSGVPDRDILAWVNESYRLVCLQHKLSLQ